MKKLFYGLGAIAAVATPVVAVVSCGSKTHELKHGDVTKESLIELYKSYGHNLSDAQAAEMVTHFGANSKFVVKSDSGEYSEKVEVIIIGGNARLTSQEAQAAAKAHLTAKLNGATPEATTKIQGEITKLDTNPTYYNLTGHTGISYSQEELAKATFTITIDKGGVTGIRAIVSDQTPVKFLDDAILGYRLNAVA